MKKHTALNSVLSSVTKDLKTGQVVHVCITIRGKPISVNHYLGNAVRGKRVIRYKTKAAKDYQNLIKDNYVGPKFAGLVKMTAMFFFGDKRLHDIDNYCKCQNDALEGVAYDDDKQIQILHIEKFIDKEDPRVEIILEEIK